MNHDQFAKLHNVTMTATPLKQRTGINKAAWNAKANHFAITINMREKGRKEVTLWTGEYSLGCGQAEAWARKNPHKAAAHTGVHWGYKWKFIDQLRAPLSSGKSYRDDSPYWKNVLAGFAEICSNNPERHIGVGSILISLQMDIMGSDQAYEDWASELGYDEDSRKGYETWETCNNIRRSLARNMTSATFEQFQDLEES